MSKPESAPDATPSRKVKTATVSGKSGGRRHGKSERKTGRLGDLPQPDLTDQKVWRYSDDAIMKLLDVPWRHHVTSPYTELADAYRLHESSQGSINFVSKLGGFLTWDEKLRFWRGGSGQRSEGRVAAKRYAQSLNKELLKEIKTLEGHLRAVQKLPDLQRREATQDALKHVIRLHRQAARNLEKHSRQKAVLEMLEPLAIAEPGMFDARPWLVGFRNGVWAEQEKTSGGLSEGSAPQKLEFRDARREDYLLNLSDIHYFAERRAGRPWDEVLQRISNGDESFQETLQDVAGYVLSGASNLRVLPWLYGPGGTGKSTFAELLSTVLGSMAVTVDPKMLSTEASRERLGAAVWGKRAVICAEAGNQRLDLEALKTLSGSDRLSVRFLYAEAFTARPRHVLIMVSNDAPTIDQGDLAFWDRVLVLPFNRSLNGDTENPRLLKGKRLESERQQPDSELVLDFTTWAVEGLQRVYSRIQDPNHKGLPITIAPECVKAKRVLQGATDLLRDFWTSADARDTLTPSDRSGEEGRVGVADLRKAYVSWSREQGLAPLKPQKFDAEARERGLVMKNNNGRFWIWPERLKETADEQEDASNDGSSDMKK